MEQSQNKVDINLKSLLEVGAHFGTKKENWDPRMSPFIFGRRNGVYIIDLEKTVSFWKKARKVIVETVAQGGTVLFVGTKKQTREVVKAEAERCGQPYIENKWQGGTLTNFDVVRKSIATLSGMEKLVEQAEAGTAVILKKEVNALKKQIAKDIARLGGIRNMKKLPDLIFVTDVTKDALAISESAKVHVPVVALADTNVNPDLITHIIPANDDATGTIVLFTRAIADAVLEGKLLYEAKLKADADNKQLEKDLLALASEGSIVEAVVQTAAVVKGAPVAKPIIVERRNNKQPSRKA